MYSQTKTGCLGQAYLFTSLSEQGDYKDPGSCWAAITGICEGARRGGSGETGDEKASSYIPGPVFNSGKATTLLKNCIGS